MQLNYYPVIDSYSPKYMVKGTELNQAIVPGCMSRYAIVEVRTYDVGWIANRGFSIRDAATVSDEDISNGKKAKQIAFFDNEDEAIAFVEKLIDTSK